MGRGGDTNNDSALAARAIPEVLSGYDWRQVFANLTASFVWQQGVPDYFIHGDHVFNLADLFIACGIFLALISSPFLVLRTATRLESLRQKEE